MAMKCNAPRSGPRHTRTTPTHKPSLHSLPAPHLMPPAALPFQRPAALQAFAPPQPAPARAHINRTHTFNVSAMHTAIAASSLCAWGHKEGKRPAKSTCLAPPTSTHRHDAMCGVWKTIPKPSHALARSVTSTHLVLSLQCSDLLLKVPFNGFGLR